jgi:leucine-rich repeat protein SHOC2
VKLFKSLKDAKAAKHEVTHLKLSLKGEFPLDILELPELRELYLDGNCPSIPCLSNLARLELISLTISTIEKGVEELLKLPRLKNLKLIGTRLSDFRIPSSDEISPLHSLTLKDCSLESLPKEIARLGLLSEINLDSNDLKDLPLEFQDLHFLKRLNLDKNKLTAFPAVLSKMKSLKHLSLDGNPFSEEEKARIQRQHFLTIH